MNFSGNSKKYSKNSPVNFNIVSFGTFCRGSEKNIKWQPWKPATIIIWFVNLRDKWTGVIVKFKNKTEVKCRVLNCKKTYLNYIESISVLWLNIYGFVLY